MVNQVKGWVYDYFNIKKYNSNIRREVIAGITNYFTVIYLIILVPEVLINAFPEAIGETGELITTYMLPNGITAGEMLVALTASAFIAAGIGTILMGMIINVPFVQGPSLSIGTFITYTICRNFGYTFYQALAIVFISGIVFFMLSIFGIEKKLYKSIPQNIKLAVTAGIGLFIVITGLQKAHIIVYGSGSVATLFSITDLASKYTRDALLAIAGVIFITVMLKKHIHGAIFIGKIVCIIVAIPLGLIKAVNFEQMSYSISFSHTFFSMDFSGLFNNPNGDSTFVSVLTFVILIFSICIMDIFETMGMLIATDSYMNSINDKIAVKKIPKVLELDAVTTAIGSTLGATTVSTYIESSTGIIEGGRTGLTSVVTGLLFFASVFITPVISIIPSAATATTLIIAGILMMNVIKQIDFEDIAEAVPAFLTMFIMPLTNSLIIGVAFGIISYLLVHVFCGKGRTIKPVIYILAVMFLVLLIFLP